MTERSQIQLKASRTGKHSGLSRRIKRANDLMQAESSISILQIVKDDISEAVKLCESANEEFILGLETEEDIVNAYDWFNDVECKGKDCIYDILIYLEKRSDASNLSTTTTTSKTSNGETLLDEHMTLASCPLAAHIEPVPSPIEEFIQPATCHIDEHTKPAPRPLDKWIDELIPYNETSVVPLDTSSEKSYQDLMLRAMYERDAPKPAIEKFDGSPLNWPRFVESFHENVHRQPYFRDVRRMSLLQDHVSSKAKDIISGYGNDGAAYAVALKELKSWCGHHSLVARAFTECVTNGAIIKDHDRAELQSFYVCLRDCVFTLRRMSYEADLNNIDTVRRATLRLPLRLRNQWAEQCYRLRAASQREPCLSDMSSWLSKRVAVLYDPILPPDASSVPYYSNGNPGPQPSHAYSTQSADSTTEYCSSDIEQHQSMAMRSQYADTDRNYKHQYVNQPKQDNYKPKYDKQSSNTNQSPRFCNYHNSSGHWTRSCNSLRKKSVDDQVKWLKEKKVCRLCLANGHGVDGVKCPIADKLFTCSKCDKKHHVNFHDAMEKLREGQSTKTLYKIQHPEISVNYKNALSPALIGRIPLSSKTNLNVGILLDSGSVITLVTLRMVRLANLSRISEEPYAIVVETVGGDTRTMEAYPYKIPLLACGSSDAPVFITGYAVEKIGSRFPNINFATAASELNIDPTSVNYPVDYMLDILIGVDNAHLCHPRVVETVYHEQYSLIYARTQIGNVLFGSHPSFAKDVDSSHYRVSAYGTRTCNINDLYNTEAMGVECSPRCGSCKCGNCTPGNGVLSLKEEHEYRNIRQMLKLENRIVVADYPWVKDPSTLPDHYGYALKRLIQFENRLLKSPSLDLFKNQFQKMVETGVYRLLTPEEDEQWRKTCGNPTHYLPYREVLKPSSKTTPLRIILDPASSPDGTCINDYWATGPNLILSLFGIQLRHREESVAIGNDINRMYNEVRTTPKIYHCHRILYREFDQKRKPDTYVVVRNSFGSRPSGAVAIAAIHLVAETGQEDYPLGATLLKNQTYVDDLIDSKPSMEIAVETMKQTEQCLALGSFTLKNWTVVDAYNLNSDCCYDTDSIKIVTNTETVLGVRWETSTDCFKFEPKINFSKKKRKIPTGPNIKEGEIFTMSEPLTLRKILSTVNGFHDPLGLISPYICTLKFTLGKLWKVMKPADPNAKLFWDLAIPPDCEKEWKKLLNAAFVISELRFPRVLRPQNTTGDPWLIVMTDSSMFAFGAVVYIRYKLVSGNYFCRLVSAKSRIWPMEPNDFISLCRGELQGAVLGKRLAQTISTESRLNFERTIFILDSEIARAQISRDSHSFDTFVANRVGEIRAKFSPDQFYTVAGNLNRSADLLSRGSTDPTKMDSNSEWQNGPTWLYTDFEEWPVSQKYTSSEPLPETKDFTFTQKTMSCQVHHHHHVSDCSWSESIMPWNVYLSQQESDIHEVKTMFDADMELNIAEAINIARHSKLTKLLCVTYRLLHVLSWKPKSGHFGKFMIKLKVVSAEQIELALQFWIRVVQHFLLHDIKTGKYKELNPAQNQNTMIWRLNGRFGEHPKGYHPILLSHDHPFVRLLVIDIHNRSHCGAIATAAKVRNEYHVMKIKKLARSVRNNCTLCRRIAKTLVKVPMAPYPLERFRPAYAFEHSSCDLFGPFALQVPGRVTRGRTADTYGKGYGLIFTCLSSRAIHVEAMEGQHTSSFLMCLRRFLSIRGQPRSMWSDQGGQIVAADQELRDIVDNWDELKLKEFGAHNGIKFEYAAPLAPWQNGVSEALIRSFKNSLLRIFSSKPRIPVLHLQTIFYEVAAVLNERPINLGHDEIPDDWDSDTNVYLCPNQLLLGRSSVRIPSGPYSVAYTKHSELFHEIEHTVNEWWESWNVHYIPTLLKQSKWHSESRQVRVGDIVYVKDNKAIRSDWKIAEISALFPSDKDGRIRNVEVRYKHLPELPLETYNGCKDRKETRDVKTLAILLTAEERNM